MGYIPLVFRYDEIPSPGEFVRHTQKGGIFNRVGHMREAAGSRLRIFSDFSDDSMNVHKDSFAEIIKNLQFP